MKRYFTILVICISILFSLNTLGNELIEASFLSLSYGEHKALLFYIPHPDQVKNKQAHFFTACFDFPLMLEHATQTQIPIILAIPDLYHTSATTDSDAPIIEGARIALAWASAYYRFATLGNCDVRILLHSNKDIPDQILKQSVHLLSCPPVRSTQSTPEEKVAQSIVHSRTMQSYSLEPFEHHPLCFRQQNPPQNIITPRPHTEKTIIITGVAGFLGSYLAHVFLDKNYYVIGLDNFICSTGENIVPLQKHDHFEFHELDVSQPFTIEGDVEYIAHLASIPSPADYYTMPVETLRSGLHGTRYALELAAHKKARILIASSSEVYGNPQVHPQPESYEGNVNPIAMRSQYDESKRGEETLAKLFYDKHAIDIRIARIFNTFGPGMRLEDGRVMTNFIQAALHNKEMIVHGNGMQTRSPAFVTDTINGLTQLLESETISQLKTIEQRIFNVGAPREYSVNQIAEIVNQIAKKYLNRTVSITHIPHFDLTDPKVRRPDIAYIQKTTGFTPTISFEEGIEEMFLHYLNRHK